MFIINNQPFNQVSDCCLTPSENICSYIMMKTSYFLIGNDDEDVLDQRDEVFTYML